MKNIIALGATLCTMVNNTNVYNEDVLFNAKWRLPTIQEVNKEIQEEYNNTGYDIGMITYDLFNGKIYVIDKQDYNELSDDGISPLNAVPIKDYYGYNNYDYELDYWTPFNINNDYNIFDYIMDNYQTIITSYNIQMQINSKITNRKIWYTYGFGNEQKEDWYVRSRVKHGEANTTQVITKTFDNPIDIDYGYYISYVVSDEYVNHEIWFPITQDIVVDNREDYNSTAQLDYFLLQNEMVQDLREQLDYTYDKLDEYKDLKKDYDTLLKKYDELNSKKVLTNVFEWFKTIFGAMGDFMNFEIAPNIKLGYLFGIPIIAFALYFIIKATIA